MINSLRGVVSFLNQPVVKQSVKEGLGLVTCAFGVLGIYNEIHHYRSLKNRVQSSHPRPSEATQEKVIRFMTKFSLVTSLVMSSPGQALSRRVFSHLFTDEQLLRYFGPNLNFATTPGHPRHVLSLLSFALGIPATVLTFVKEGAWLIQKATQDHPPLPVVSPKSDEWVLSRRQIRWMATWDTLTSRPALHLVNHVVSMALGR
jgi:hypothetical protein